MRICRLSGIGIAPADQESGSPKLEPRLPCRETIIALESAEIGLRGRSADVRRPCLDGDAVEFLIVAQPNFVDISVVATDRGTAAPAVRERGCVPISLGAAGDRVAVDRTPVYSSENISVLRGVAHRAHQSILRIAV